MSLVNEFFSFQNGYAFKSSDFVYKGKYKIIKIKELKDGLVKFFDDTAEINVPVNFDVDKYIVRKGDVLFALTGDPVNKPNPLSWVGRVSYYDHDEPALLNQRVCKAIPKGNIPGEYLYYFFRQEKEFYRLASKATGSASQANISTKTIEQHPITVPAGDISGRIIDFLRNIDVKISVNEAINRNLSEQAQAYFDELFIQNASAEWKEGTLSDVGSIVAGGTPFKSNQEYYTDNGIAWITPKDLSVDKSVFISHGENDITELGLQKSSATMMPAGTVLFSSRAPIGYIAIAANDICTNQGFKSVVPNGNVGTSYVYYLLKQLLPTIENMASGSTFKEISGSAMKIVPTVIPDDETLKRFSDFCDPIMKQIWKNEQESKRLVELRDSLLPKLMSGDLDVSDLDI